VHHGIIGMEVQDRFDIARPIGIKPVNRNGHRVKGGTFHLLPSK
jgi:hypothetical protein